MGRLGPLVASAVVGGLVVFVVCFMLWHHLGGGAWRGEVDVMDARLHSPDELSFDIASCNGYPRVRVVETDKEVRVRAVAYSTPLRGGEDCGDGYGPLRLQEPLGNRDVIDMHSGRVVLSPAEVELNTHQALWRQAGVGDYSYVYDAQCECADNYGQPVRLSVTDGRVRSVVYAESGALPLLEYTPRYHSVDSLFDLIQDAVDNQADSVSVSYDGVLWYPTKIEIDYSSNAVDDEYILTVFDFSPR